MQFPIHGATGWCRLAIERFYAHGFGGWLDLVSFKRESAVSGMLHKGHRTLKRFVRGIGQRESFRFLIAGGSASLINWLARFPLSIVMPFVASVAVAYAIGMAFGFVLYRKWVFVGSTLSLSHQIWRFIAINGLGFLTVVAVSWIAESVVMTATHRSSNVLTALIHAAAIIAGALVNFFGHRMVTFAARKPVI